MLRPLIDRLFRAYEARDKEAALACYADDVVLVDPHYPGARMEGKAALADSVDWAFENARSLGFSVRHAFEEVGDDDGVERAVVEVDSHHVWADGAEARFPQLFVFEARDGLVTEVRAYQMYPPPA